LKLSESVFASVEGDVCHTRWVPANRPTAADVTERLAALRHEQHLPDRFSNSVEVAAENAAQTVFSGGPGTQRLDLTDLRFETLDPFASTDLDQAFAISADGEDIVLHYALADIEAFAPRGGVIEQEAWRRGVTVYAPDVRVPLYPAILSQNAASLLPGGPRPAVVFNVQVSPDGEPTLRSVTRAVIRSRTKRAYETTELADLNPLIVELHRRNTAAETRRGATKIDWPEQQVVPDPAAPGGFGLELRPMLPSEEVNASMSLAVNIAVAKVMLEHKTGLFRIMPGPDPVQQKGLRRVARALGIDWRPDADLRSLLPTLDTSLPQHAKFLVEARRAGRGASYAVFDPSTPPWHSALASYYAHATAPMRRLADRYVIELVLALEGSSPSDSLGPVASALAKMPAIMAAADRRARAVESGAIDLLEAVALSGRVGDLFTATILESSAGGFVVQLADPPVRARATVLKSSEAATSALARVDSNGPDSGEQVQVRLSSVDLDARRVKFELCDG
jgi:exoribonuclease R